jgi:hypothetical protein
MPLVLGTGQPLANAANGDDLFGTDFPTQAVDIHFDGVAAHLFVPPIELSDSTFDAEHRFNANDVVPCQSAINSRRID